MQIVSHTETNKRSDNQDTFWWGTFTTPVASSSGVVAAVFDGMGGLSNGSEASKLAARTLSDTVSTGDATNSKILKSLQDSHQGIVKFESRAGSTASILRLYEGDYSIFHLGDSRVYKLIPDAAPQLLTVDHSAINDFRDRGIEITPELVHKYQNQVTRGLGKVPFVQPDTYSGTYIPGDVFLVCSDGFWHYFDARPGSLDPYSPTGLQDFAKLASDAGETDNITALLVFTK